MPIITSIVAAKCDRCAEAVLCTAPMQAEELGWYVSFGGSPNEGDAIVFCPECREMEPWILGRDAGKGKPNGS